MCAHNMEGAYVCHGTCDEDNEKLGTLGHLLHFCEFKRWNVACQASMLSAFTC